MTAAQLIAPEAPKPRNFLNDFFAYWAVGVVVVVVLAGVGLLLYPKWNKIQQTQVTEYETAQDALLNAQEQLIVLQDANKKLAQLNYSDITRANAVLPTQLNISLLMQQVESQFAAEGFTLQSIDVVEDATTQSKIPGVQTVQLNVNLSGNTSYDSFKHFLEVSVTVAPLLQLSSISYAPELDSFVVVFTTYVAS